MALSNSYSFAPSLGELGLYALSRCDIRNTAIEQQHMFDLRMAANLVCQDFSNKGVNLWQISLVSQPLTQGVASYAVDPAVVVILDAYRSQGTGQTTTDQILLPISRSEYASYSNKQQQGVPTVFWMDRTLAPSVTLYLTPDGEWPTLNYYVVRQLMDANLANGGGVDVPAVWLKAFSDALIAELSLTWAYEKYPTFKSVADATYLAAADQNIETAAQYVLPQMAGYWRS